MTFASYPRSPNLQDGFRDVNYLQLANAINACAWWIEDHIGKGHNFETLAYIGPSDLRYAIITVAAIKTGYKVSSAGFGPALMDLVLTENPGLFHITPE